MPTLHWIGKEKVINHHRDVPFKVLEHQYRFSSLEGGVQGTEGVDSIENASNGNKIIHGDNLEALKALLPQYEGKIKCIYIDPPYNTGNEGWVYNDNVNDPKIKKWLGEVVGKESEDLSRHDKWLCMMYPRLKLLHRLLAKDGAIFISIDDNEQANLKLMCDEIFGVGNFITDLIWRSSDSSNHDSKQFSVDFNHTLVYSKASSWEPFRLERKAENNAHYKNPDNDPRGPWFSGNVSSPNPRENLRFEIITPSGKSISPPKNGWRWSKERVRDMIEDEIIVFSEDESRIIKKTFLKDQSGIIPSNIWDDIDETGHNRNAKYELIKIFHELKTSDIFKTPKPTKFIEKILKIAISKDDIILDSFAGSGTTAHALLNLNKQDGGNRKFILVEMEDYAETITAERVKRVMTGYGEDSKAVEGTGGSFDYYTLGQSIFLPDGNLNEAIGTDKIREYVWYSETQSPLLGGDIGVGSEEKHLLGKANDTAYYFHYEPEQVTVLDMDFLRTLRTKADQYIIYADKCLLEPELMQKYHIVFKKIPRDITRF
ncbi:MAG: type III restriction endonuclease subunit M [Flammeovirgaceae bacterium]|nr:type III restriction endonuclease subunit M [Flammeovirgaceae bacterium]HCX21130.1 type III restriction endonuclease subunit M [Cytophagales bacterium]|tara:strand:+ start:846 stop:2474 length:1629 start_codon:yes stop_codon:yes gene_type:complete